MYMYVCEYIYTIYMYTCNISCYDSKNMLFESDKALACVGEMA